jgi:hypothetical protein
MFKPFKSLKPPHLCKPGIIYVLNGAQRLNDLNVLNDAQ